MDFHSGNNQTFGEQLAVSKLLMQILLALFAGVYRGMCDEGVPRECSLEQIAQQIGTKETNSRLCIVEM